MELIGDRMHYLITAGLRSNLTQFSQEIGLNSPVSISRIVNHKTTSPGVDIFQNIKKAFPSVNIEWLITGEGQMMIDGELEKKSFDASTELLQELKQHNEYMRQLTTQFVKI